MAGASCMALRASPAVTTGYGRFGRPGPYQAQFGDPVQHAGNSEIRRSSGLAGHGEIRTRTGDTTVLSRAHRAAVGPRMLEMRLFGLGRRDRQKFASCGLLAWTLRGC
jgi:hypothetical protein